MAILRSESNNWSYVPIHNPKPSWFGPCAAIALQLGVVILLIVTICHGIWLEDNGNYIAFTPLSTAVRTIYVTGMTLLATIVSSYTSNQLRTLWLREVVGIVQVDVPPVHSRRTVAVLLGQGNTSDSVKVWPTSLSLLITGLITTGIVAGLSLSNENYTQSYTAGLSRDTVGDIAGDVAGEFNPGFNPCIVSASNDSYTAFHWQLPDGSFIGLNGTEEDICAPQVVMSTLVASSPLSYPGNIAYTIFGTPIGLTAVGTAAPFGEDLSTTFGIGVAQAAQTHLERSENCLPVLASNPVHCQKAGTVTVHGNNLTVQAGGCQVSSSVFAVDPSVQGASVAGACTDGLPVGKATLLIGSVNDHANLLAGVMYDYSIPTEQSWTNYSVACQVDIAPAISFRKVTYSLYTSNPEYKGEITPSTYYISGDDSTTCTPYGRNTSFSYSDFNGTWFDYPLQQQLPSQSLLLSDFITDTVLATAASASWQLLNQNNYADGWWATLHSAAVNWRLDYEIQSIFNSSNPLEHVFGLASGIALSVLWGAIPNRGEDIVVITSGKSEFIGVRVGPGEWWTIVFAVPSLFSIALLLWLLWRTRKDLPNPRDSFRIKVFNRGE